MEGDVVVDVLMEAEVIGLDHLSKECQKFISGRICKENVEELSILGTNILTTPHAFSSLSSLVLFLTPPPSSMLASWFWSPLQSVFFLPS